MELKDTHYYEPEHDPELLRIARSLQVIKAKWKKGEKASKHELKDMENALLILRDKGLITSTKLAKGRFQFTDRGYAMLHLIDALHGNNFLVKGKNLDITDMFSELLLHKFSKNLEMFQIEKERFHQRLKDAYGINRAEDITKKKITRELMEQMGLFENPLFKAIYLTMEINAQLGGKDGMVDIMESEDTLRPKEEHKGMVASALDFMMSDARIFHCSKPVKEMLIETKNKIGKRRLPFPNMFINTDFRIKDMDVYGILIFQLHEDKGELVYCKDPKCPEQSDRNHGFGVYGIGFKEKDKSLRYGYGTISPSGGLQFTKDDFVKKIGMFACNFLDFLLDPNVRFVKADGSVEKLKGGHKALKNAYEQKRIDLSKTYFVKIAEPLQKYVDQWVRLRGAKGYSHKFWVRGHFRWLMAERYAENIGKKLWIAPFLKGKGVILHKEYDVDKSKTNTMGICHQQGVKTHQMGVNDMTRKPKRPITRNVMQGVDEWNDGFGKMFREFVEKIQQNSFNRGVDAHLGSINNKPVGTRHYNSRKAVKRAILFAVNGACKEFEKDHDVKIPQKNSLTKRIAGQLQTVFERYEKFIVDNERKKE